MLSVMLNVEVIPAQRTYKKLAKEFDKIKKVEPGLTWERFECMLSERVQIKSLVKAAREVAKDYTTGGNE